MGLLVDKISGGFVADSVGEPEKCIYETASYQSGQSEEIGGTCNGEPIEITRVFYDFNVCKYDNTDWGCRFRRLLEEVLPVQCYRHQIHFIQII